MIAAPDESAQARHFGLHGINRHRHCELGCRRQDRLQSPDFLIDRHGHRVAVGTGGFCADIQDICALCNHPMGLIHGARRIEEPSAIRERVGGHIDDAHDQWASKRKQAREPIERMVSFAGGAGLGTGRKHRSALRRTRDGCQAPATCFSTCACSRPGTERLTPY